MIRLLICVWALIAVLSEGAAIEPGKQVAFFVKKKGPGMSKDGAYLSYSTSGALNDVRGRDVTEESLRNFMKTESGEASEVKLRVIILAPAKTNLQDVGKLMDMFSRNRPPSSSVTVTFYIE